MHQGTLKILLTLCCALAGLSLGKNLLAQSNEKSKPKTGHTRPNDKTNINLEGDDISGARRTPMGSLINQKRTDNDYHLVKLRQNWRKEMIRSAHSINSSSSLQPTKSP